MQVNVTLQYSVSNPTFHLLGSLSQLRNSIFVKAAVNGGSFPTNMLLGLVDLWLEGYSLPHWPIYSHTIKDLRNDFNSGDKQFRCSVLKLFCVHVAPRPPRLCPRYGLGELVRRDLGTGLQEAYGLDVNLQTGLGIGVYIRAAVCIAALGRLQGLLQGSQHRLTQSA